MRVDDYLSKEDIREFTARSDLAGLRMLGINWLMIAAIFWAASTWTNPVTLLLAVVLLGGRQLGLSVMQHEAGHGTLFRTPWMNNVLTQWFAALPVLGDIPSYAASHRQHHKLAGSHDDPDLPNYENYPVSAASFRRKLWRDVTGQTGTKLLVAITRGAGNRIMMREGEGSGSPFHALLANAVLLAILTLFGIPEFYLLWVAAFLTSFMLVARIRQVAEHGAVKGLYDADPRLNTRTTVASWYERLVLCPCYVNYHLEHHLLASVPAHKLPRLHRVLEERGFFREYPDAVAHGYWGVIKRAVPEFDRSLAPAG